MAHSGTQEAFSVIGTGIDVVDIEAIKRVRFIKRFAEYFLTKKELPLVPKNSKVTQHLASRFAAKEAVMKAFPKKLRPHDFSIEKKGNRPTVTFNNAAYNKKYRAFVSLTHTRHVAAAIAVIVHTKS